MRRKIPSEPVMLIWITVINAQSKTNKKIKCENSTKTVWHGLTIHKSYQKKVSHLKRGVRSHLLVLSSASTVVESMGKLYATTSDDFCNVVCHLIYKNFHIIFFQQVRSMKWKHQCVCACLMQFIRIETGFTE